MELEEAFKHLHRKCETIDDPLAKKTIQGALKNLESQIQKQSESLEETQSALSSIEKRFEQLYHKTPAIIISLDKNLTIYDVSDSWLETFDYKKENVIGHSFYKFISEGSRGNLEKEIVVQCIKKGASKEIAIQILRKETEAVDVLAAGTICEKIEGEGLQATLLIQDISQLKNAENALKEQEVKKRAHLKAIETPLKDSVQKLTAIKDKLPIELQKDVDNVLESLSHENLFRPNFAKSFHDLDMDSEINRWLIAEYSTVATTYGYLPAPEKSTQTYSPEYDLLASIEFNTFEYSQNQKELVEFVIKMFKHFDILNTFQISEEGMRFFLHCIKAEYRNVPYHNFLHAFDVVQTLFYFLTEGGLSQYLTNLDVFALLMSGIGHDLGHPGLNNQFQIATNSPLALLYNDQSILENLHASTFFSILHQQRANLLENMSADELEEFRKVVVTNILSTDMKHHFEILTIFSNRVKKTKIFDHENPDDRILLMKLALKCADVSNACRPHRIARKWSLRVMEEFFHQGDLERAAGMPVSSFMDRDESSIPKSQVAFIEFIAKPLYGSFALVLPRLQVCMRNLEENSKRWNTLLVDEEELKKQRKKTEDSSEDSTNSSSD